MSRQSSGQLTIHAIHRPGSGWFYEIWTYGGELKHTTAVYRWKAAALQAAKDWRKQYREAKKAASLEGLAS